MQTTPYDLFLSHGAADIEWVRLLHAALEAKGLRVFLDQNAIESADNFVLTIDEALAASRFLAVVLSKASAERPWVIYEWTTFKAQNGPLGRIIPVALEALNLPVGLIATQAINAIDRDAVRVANELLRTIGRLRELPIDDPRLPTIGQELTFVLSSTPDKGTLEIVMPDERRRSISTPWRRGKPLELNIELFRALSSQAIRTDEEWEEIHRCGESVGQELFRTLFDDTAVESLSRAIEISHTPPVLTLLSAEDDLLAQPWELMHDGSAFLIHEGQIDLLRSTVHGNFSRSLSRPTEQFRLLVNVSAPRGHEISYEEESYRISRILADRCEMVSCELGTLDDLVTIAAHFPATGIHFSGHGGAGVLMFETDENEADEVQITQLVQRLRTETPSGLPQFFYLACCHGNTARPLTGSSWETSAARLHREGVTEVIGYFGPMAEHLSTEAETALYEVIAAGRTTRFAVRQARIALACAAKCAVSGSDADPPKQGPGGDAYPFAWSQLVFYRRGPEYPLSLSAAAPVRHGEDSLHRTFMDAGNRRILTSGFVGRRNELHKIRRQLRAGQKAFVFHGLGGVGKTTLAVHLLSILGSPENICTVWCQERPAKSDPANWILRRLIDYGRERFGDEMDEYAVTLERKWGSDLSALFRAILDKLLSLRSRIVIYLDNLESLMIGPESESFPDEFTRWSAAETAALWSILLDYAVNTEFVYLLATSRYLNETIPASYQFPVPPLGRDALFRLTKWFPALQRLSAQTRARLAERLAGHPRAVEFANGLIDYSITQWEKVHGAWTIPQQTAPPHVLEQEWKQLVASVLPDLQRKLEANMLLDAIWNCVLTDRGRRMLYRMSLLRADRCAWPFLAMLGEKDEPLDAAEDTALQLLRTSLLGIFDERPTGTGDQESTRFYSLHPSTVAHVRHRFGDDPALRHETHARLGEILTAFSVTDHFEFDARHRLYLRGEAAYHLFECGDYRSAAASTYEVCIGLLRYGRNREVLELVEPFEEAGVLGVLPPMQKAMLFDVSGRAHRELKHFDLALRFHEKSVEAAKTTGDRSEEARAIANLANVYLAMEESEKAFALLEEAREIGHRDDDPASAAIDLGNLGALYMQLNRFEEAAKCLEEALQLAAEHGEPTGNHLGNLGSLYAMLGDYDKAVAHFERALSDARQNDRPLLLDHALRQIAKIRIRTDEGDKATELLERALKIADETGNVDRQKDILSLLAEASSIAGRQSDVIKYSRRAVLLAKDAHDGVVAAKESARIGLVYYDQGQWEKGGEWFEKAVTLARQEDDAEGTLIWLSMFSECCGNLGRLEEQERACSEAITIARSVSSLRHEHQFLNNLGVVFYTKGRLSEAVNCFQKALTVIEQCEDKTRKLDYVSNLVLALRQLGQVGAAFSYIEQELRICRRSDKPDDHRRLLEMACTLCQDHYDKERVITYGAELIELERRAGDGQRELVVLQTVASSHYRAEAWQAAADILTQAVEAARRFQDIERESDALMMLSETYHRLGAVRLEIESCESLLAVARATGNFKREVMCHDRLGVLHLSQEEPEKALGYLQEAVHIHKISGGSETMVQLANLGAALLALDRAAEAINSLERAAQLARDSRDEKQLAGILANLGNAYVATGHTDLARDALQTAITRGETAGHADAVKAATNLLAGLPPSKVDVSGRLRP